MTFTKDELELLKQIIEEESNYEHWKYSRNYHMSCAITNTYWMPHYLEVLEHADKQYQPLHQILEKLESLIEDKPIEVKERFTKNLDKKPKLKNVAKGTPLTDLFE